jgi:hypothetical protein
MPGVRNSKPNEYEQLAIYGFKKKKSFFFYNLLVNKILSL